MRTLRAAASFFDARIAALLLTLSGCGPRDHLEPPILHLGEDVCSHCSMIISEARFAAANVVTNAGGSPEPGLFDDAACLVAAEEQSPQKDVAARWVADSQGWMDAASAYFVKSPEIRSPMGGGALAARTQAEAHALGEKTHGTILRFDELRLELRKGQSHGS
ncbi:MAG TPA: nitrous oxide reductase accessory protein NosL [bacterium]|nr:nitrous oxide reductase accessory protein NosL [bacterium]